MLGRFAPVTFKGSCVVLSGATSGLGLALARECLSRGVKTLAVIGRNRKVLESLRSAGAAQDCTVLCLVCDFNQDAAWVQESLNGFMTRVAAVQLPDLVIACAGVSTTRGADGLEDLFEIRRAVAVNVLSSLSLLYLGATLMTKRGRGRLCVISSLASLVTLGSSALYGATKCCLNSYAAALRSELQSRGVGVTCVVPGFVASPMSARFKGRRPLMLSAGRAATRVLNALERGQDELYFPYLLYVGIRLLALLPAFLKRAILKAFAFEVLPDRELSLHKLRSQAHGIERGEAPAAKAEDDELSAQDPFRAASGKAPLGMHPDVCTETNIKVATLRRPS